MTIAETVKWFDSIYDINRVENQAKSDFWVGATSDIESVKKKKDILLLGITRCSNGDIARQLFEDMRAEGFGIDQLSTRDEGGAIFVFLYKKR